MIFKICVFERQMQRQKVVDRIVEGRKVYKTFNTFL